MVMGMKGSAVLIYYRFNILSFQHRRYNIFWSCQAFTL